MKIAKIHAAKNARKYGLAMAVLVVAVLVHLYLTTAAVVGLSRITKKQVVRRNEVMKIYDPAETRDFGLQQLIRTHVRREVLRRNGVVINDGDLRAEARRIDNETLAPDKVSKIKELFGKDEGDFLKVFVLPALVDRKIYSLVTYGNRELQKESYQKAQSFMTEVSMGLKDDFYKAVQARGGHPRELTLSTKTGFRWRTPGETASRGREESVAIQNISKAQEFEREVFQKLKPGQVPGAPIEYDDVWWAPVIEKIETKPGEKIYKIKVGVFLKADPSAWLEQQSKDVKVFVL